MVCLCECSEQQSSEISALLQELEFCKQPSALQPPSTTDADSLTTRILNCLSSLRTAVYARAQYLECLIPNFPTLEYKSVNVLPEYEKVAVVDDTESRPTSPSARKKKIAHSAKKEKSSTSRSRRSAEEDEPAPLPTSFLPLINHHIQSCKDSQIQLVKGYMIDNPDRLRPTNEEEEEAERQKEAAKAKDKKKRSNKKKNPTRAEQEKNLDVSLPPAIEAHCQSELERSTAKHRLYTEEFVNQVTKLYQLLDGLGSVVFSDILNRSVSALNIFSSTIQSGFDASYQQSLNQQRSNHSQMKPSLQYHSNQIFHRLCHEEQQRFTMVQELITNTRNEQLTQEVTESNRFIIRLSHASQTLLLILDTMILPIDLQSIQNGEILVARKSLKHLIKEKNRREKSTVSASNGPLSPNGNSTSARRSASSSRVNSSNENHVAETREEEQRIMRWGTATFIGIKTDQFVLPQHIQDEMRPPTSKLLMSIVRYRTKM